MVQGGPRRAEGAPQIRISEFFGGIEVFEVAEGGSKGVRGAPKARGKFRYPDSLG